MPLSSPRVPSAETEIPTVLVTLEILHGRTKYPHRPVHAPRYLIGSAEACDLRLGGTAIPRLHSLIAVEAQTVRIELLAAAPALLVNGQAVRDADLRDGDVIRIGDFELQVQVAATTMPAERPADDRTPQELSALELVDRLEEETKMVADVERRRQLGAAALLDAARELQPAVQRHDAAPLSGPHFTPRPAAVPAATTQDLVRELDQLGRTLHELSVELDQQHAQATHRESTYAAATQGLLETQHALTEQIEALARQVSDLQVSVRPARPRAIA